MTNQIQPMPQVGEVWQCNDMPIRVHIDAINEMYANVTMTHDDTGVVEQVIMCMVGGDCPVSMRYFYHRIEEA